jgi:vitamin B12 transporter
VLHRHLFLGLSLSLAIAAWTVRAAEPVALDTLVVSASRIAIPNDRIGSAVTVITRDELDARQLPFVADVLRDVPGLAVSRAGGLGGVTQVRIRGAEGNHTLVLIDGVEANNPVAGGEFDFAHLATANIERIEILRGAQSALYGSHAIGGVINILTRRDQAGSDLQLRVGAGTLGTQDMSARVSGSTTEGFGSLSISHFSTDGTSVAASGSENDGHDNLTLAAQAGWTIADELEIRATLRRTESQSDFDEFDFTFPATATQGLLVDGDGTARFRQWLSQIQAELSSGPWRQRVDLAHSSAETRFLDGDLFSSESRGQRLKLGYQASRTLTERQQLTLALEHERLDYRNLGATPTALENQQQNTDQTSGILEYQVTLGRADLMAGLRHDRNERFADTTTYRLTGSMNLNRALRLHASAGTGVTNPGFFELFGFFPGSFVGNPKLKPEHADSFDLGLESRLLDERLILDVTLFRATLTDEIQTTFDFSNFTSSAINLTGKSKRSGAEVSLAANLAPWWRLTAAYTLTDSKQPDGRTEIRRPRHVGALDNTFSFASGRGRVHIGLDFNGQQDDLELIFATPADRIRLDSFTLINIAADFALTRRWQLFGRIENLLDTDYQEQFSYAGRGRSVLAGFEFRLP